MFSCDIFEIFKNTYFEEHMQTAASVKFQNPSINDCCYTQEIMLRSTHRRPSVRKVFSEISQNSQENTCARVSFFKKETLAQFFSCEFCEISKNNFFMEHLRATASECSLIFSFLPSNIFKICKSGLLM